ncbi:MAG: hypothetical protein PUF01_02695 [Eubacteriales bacterium]|nr:hypothetical protein [Eubacteriales bacterium]
MKYIIIFILIAALFLIIAGVLIIQNIKLKKENEALEIRNILAECENNKRLRKLRHDVINQNFTVDMLLQKGDSKAARDFLSGRESRLEGIIPKNFCANYIINGILLFENNKCEENKVTLNCKANVANDDLKPSGEELCIIFDTLFNLAIKNTKDNSIDLICKSVNSTLFINLAFYGKSEKSKLKKAVAIVNKYNGKIEINNNDSEAKIKIFI